MSHPATNLINPAAACPDWCTNDHEYEDRLPNEHGFWCLLHTSTPTFVITAEQELPDSVAVQLSVSTEQYVSETPADCSPRELFIKAVDRYGTEESFALTARQALRLAEVLVQQASVVLAEETAQIVGVDR